MVKRIIRITINTFVAEFEEEIRKVLLVLGKTKTKNVLAMFKTQLADPDKKTKFARIMKKLAHVVEERGEKFVVIKEEYKGGAKNPPKPFI